MTKRLIPADDPSGTDTDHLRPVIDFLKANGHTPANGDTFSENRDGLQEYFFAEEVDIALLGQHFSFPPSIHLSAEGVFDTRHFVLIRGNRSTHPAR